VEIAELLPRPTPRRQRYALAAVVVLLTVPAAVFLGLIAWVPPHLEVRADRQGLRIVTGWSPLERRRTVPAAAVADLRKVEVHDGRRVVGTAMPGYCVGRFRYPRLGTVWQATDCTRHGVLVRVSGWNAPLLLTPPEPERLRAALAGGPPYEYRHGTGRRAGPTAWVLRASSLVMAMTAVALLLLVLAAPQRLRYRVRPGTLEVRTLLFTRRFPLAGAAARITTPRIGLRLWGVGIPGYLTGWFRVDGRTTRLYVTDHRGPCVLLQGPRRLLLSPADPAAMLAALAEAGAAVERP